MNVNALQTITNVFEGKNRNSLSIGLKENLLSIKELYKVSYISMLIFIENLKTKHITHEEF